jgi:hypothetical protein
LFLIFPLTEGVCSTQYILGSFLPDFFQIIFYLIPLRTLWSKCVIIIPILQMKPKEITQGPTSRKGRTGNQMVPELISKSLYNGAPLFFHPGTNQGLFCLASKIRVWCFSMLFLVTSLYSYE